MELYSLHRLSRNSQDFVNSFIGTNRARSDAFCFAVASALVNNDSFRKLDDSFFEPKTQIKISGIVNQLNEMFRFDPTKVFNYVNKIVKFRIAQLRWTCATNVIHSEETAIADFFGISDHFSGEDLLVIKTNRVSIVYDTLKLNDLFRDLNILVEEKVEETND